MTQAEQGETARIKAMLRTIQSGDAVVTTRHAPGGAGKQGVVIESNPFQTDGVRRVKVHFPADGEGSRINVLPASIEVVR